jgi:hypothetical protein
MEADLLVSSSPASANWATTPTVSVIIASHEPEDVLIARIASIRTRFDPLGTEYVVAWAASGRTTGELKRRFPHVRLISTPPDTALGELRIQGMKAAAGDIVLLLQRYDSSMPADCSDGALAHFSDVPSNSAKWTERLSLGAHRESARVASTS